MPSPLNVPITPPRVAFIDARNGNVSREWYMFFLSLYQTAGGSSISLDDLQKGPPSLTVDEINAIINRATGSMAPSEQGALDQIAELRKQVDALELQVRPELGTMAALQQDNVPWLKFDTSPTGFPTGAAANGTLYWDDADNIKTLNLVMEDSGGVIQQIGEETYYRIKASAAITNGQVVMFTGTVGASGGLRGAPATGLTAFQNEYIMGVATQNIANNGWGYVTWFGLVRGINTTGGAEAWVDGQILYYNPAVPGGLTKTVPVAPNPKVIVASVVHAATNGSLFVRPTFGSALGATDSNVEITGLANGDLLQYDGVQQRWENIPASSVSIGTATNLAGGAAGSIPYRSAASTTAMLAIGTAAQVLQVNAGATAPQWVNTTGTGDVVRATSPTISNATAFQSLTMTGATVPFKWTVNAGATDFLKLESPGYALNTMLVDSNGNIGFSTTTLTYRVNVNGTVSATTFRGAGTDLTGTATALSIGGNAATATTATNVAGGAAGSLHYQTAAATTAMLAIGTAAQVLQVNAGATAPEWVSSTGTGNVVRATNATLTTPKATTTIGVGNATPSASGSGITFPAAISASSDANTLDDYEEGTWTPTWTGLTTVGSATTNIGYYVKVGRIVYYAVFLQYSTSFSSTQGTTYHTLPFNPAVSSGNTASNESNAAVVYTGIGLTYSGTALAYVPSVGATNTKVVFSGTYYSA